MEHPIFFISLLLEKLGLPIVHDFGEAHTILEKVLLPHITYTWLVMIFLVVVIKMLLRRIELVPRGAQNFFEVVIGGMEEFMVDVTGDEGRFVFPLIGTLAFYILLCNYMGLAPGMFSPTANLNTTLACAIVVVFYTHVIGVKFHGAKYIKHFLGPVIFIAPLMFIIEVIGHLARALSLSIRLFGNIFGKEMVLGIFVFLAGWFLAPLPILFLGLFVGGVQTLIFCLLSMMYFAGAIEHAH
ncbi:MAG: F0F1 ATP synthase subunit A [Deltaproteobacteria bacterium]|jgi:F-type H+-transporting ATPase subunit a|nr:MAG: F0F1 ATP synthase subunit A [Deltaproteobacteria bacterium]